MKTKIVTVFLWFFASLLFVIQSPAQTEATFKKFAGTYVTGHDFGGGSISLGADGAFSAGGASDDGTAISSTGKYVLSNGILVFTEMKKTGTRRDEKEFDLLDPKDIQEWSNGHEGGEIQKEFKLLPVQWSGRIYLIYESELKNFANAINLGIEPRSSLTADPHCSPWYGSFYLRQGDEKKKVVGAPGLPEEWRAFLLSMPLKVTVLSVQEVKKEKYLTESTVTVNKGTKNGLKVGMRLLMENEIPSQWDGAEVISVDSSTAKVKATGYNTELKVLDKLHTRFVPRERQYCKYLEIQRLRTISAEKNGRH